MLLTIIAKDVCGGTSDASVSCAELAKNFILSILLLDVKQIGALYE